MSLADTLPGLPATHRFINSPLTEEMLSPPSDKCQIIQFSSALFKQDYVRLAGFIDEYPRLQLSVFGNYKNDIANLNFLEYFGDSRIERFQVDINDLKDINGLKHLPPRLKYLGLGNTKSKSFSLDIIVKFKHLEELYLEGHKKDIEIISSLRSLQKLTLRSITVPDLSFVANHPSLWALDIKLGGTKNLEHIPLIRNLKYLELWRILGLDTIDSISDAVSLQFVFLQDIRRLGELPSFVRLHNLRRVHIENLKELVELSPISEAPNLEEMVISRMNHLSPDVFKCFIGHPNLSRVFISLGAKKRNTTVEKMLQLDRARYIKDDLFRFR